MHLKSAQAILVSYLECKRLHSFLGGGGDIKFWFSFVVSMLVFGYAYVFNWLCPDVRVVHNVLLHVRYDSHYTISSMHWVAPQHTLGLPVL